MNDLAPVSRHNNQLHLFTHAYSIMQWDAAISPEDFERFVQQEIRRTRAILSDFRVERREHLSAADGTYEIDVSARFRALDVDFLVLVECKHHRSPIKREVVQILNDRIRSLGAQKGMLFSTSRFQTGAAEYARTHGIALIHVMDGQFMYQVRSATPSDYRLPGIPKFVSALACYGVNQEGRETVSYRTLGRGDAKLIVDSLNSQSG